MSELIDNDAQRRKELLKHLILQRTYFRKDGAAAPRP